MLSEENIVQNYYQPHFSKKTLNDKLEKRELMFAFLTNMKRTCKSVYLFVVS
jgi:hypothetical protein